jgi:hypothetical protein
MEINFNAFRYLVSHALVILISSLLPYGKKNLSGIFFMSAMMFIFIPMSVMYGFNKNLPSDAILAAILAVLICYLMVNTRFARVKVPIANASEPIAVVIAIVFLLIFVGWTLVSGAVANINFDFTRIYIHREIAGSLLDVGFMPHINLWAQKVFNPLLLAHGLYRKNKFLVLIALVMQVYFFGVTQHRRHLFLPILVYMIYKLYASNLTLARLYSYAAIAVLTFLGVTLIFELDAVAAIVLRRAFFVPASVNFDWIAFFLERPKVYFSDNLLAGISASIYKGENLPLLLGEFMAPGRQFAFNCGMIGAGFAQMGYFGVTLYAFVLGAIVKFVNALIRQGVPVFLAAALLFAPLRTAWADSDVFTALLSHGIAVCIVMLWLIGKPRKH